MDQSGIDRLIEVLEKGQASELQKFDSPPVTLNGRRGIWRMVRGFRTFIEVGANYKPQAGVLPNGKILFGPPSIKGQNSGELSDETLAAITPKETNESFSQVDVAGNGLQNLKAQVKETLGPDDTRHPAIDKASSVEELVPIARSAGFLDSEIKSGLKGDKVVPGEDAEAEEAPAEEKSNVVDFAGAKNRLRGTKPKTEKPELPAEKPEEKPELPATGTDGPSLRALPAKDKPKSGPSKDNGLQGGNLVQGALALALGSSPQGQDKDAERRQDAAGKLREAAARAKTDGEPKLADLYGQLANLIIPDRADQNREALERVGREILAYHKGNEAPAKPETAEGAGAKDESPAKPEAAAAPEAPEATENTGAKDETPEAAPATDKELIQDAIDNANQRVEQNYEKFVDEAKGEIERAKELALAEILEGMEAAAKNPQVKMQLRRAKNDLRANKRNRRYTMMRLLRILRILLALVPGV